MAPRVTALNSYPPYNIVETYTCSMSVMLLFFFLSQYLIWSFLYFTTLSNCLHKVAWVHFKACAGITSYLHWQSAGVLLKSLTGATPGSAVPGPTPRFFKYRIEEQCIRQDLQYTVVYN